MRYWELSITNKIDNKNDNLCVLCKLLAVWFFVSSWNAFFDTWKCSMCLCFSKLGHVMPVASWYCLDFASFTGYIQCNSLNKRFSLLCTKKILNVFLLYVTPNYVFCLSYEFRKLIDKFLTSILKNYFFVGYDRVYYITWVNVFIKWSPIVC